MPGALTHRLLGRIPRPRLPARTARLRLTALYGGLFLLCGAVLLGVLYLLFTRAVAGQLPSAGPRSSYGILRSAAAPSAFQAGQQALAESARMQQVASDRDQLLIQSGIALGIVTVIAVALGRLAARRVLHPLSTITATARRISASSLHERLSLRRRRAQRPRRHPR